MESIKLLDYQVPHVEQLTKILMKTHCAMDLSLMGCGKTYTTTELCKRIGFPRMVVICPATIEAKWKGMAKYGVNIFKVISYQSLRSRKGCNPQHSLLNRFDDPKDNSTTFTPTDTLKQIVKEGCLFVFDEAQNIKNKNDQWLACKAISHHILSSGGISRFMLLSGTPIDKEEHALHLMGMMGFIRHPKLFNFRKEDNILRLYGARELIDYCTFINKCDTEKFLLVNRFTKDTIRHNCYLLFQRILKPYITASMPPPKLKVEMNCKNGYFNILNEEDKVNLNKGIASLNSATMYNETSNTAEITSENMGSITKALMKIEDAKISTFIRVGLEQLKAVPNCKIGIFVHYNSSLEKLEKAFTEYNPIVLQGKIPKERRQILIDEYQKPDLSRRVLISNLQVCATGVDLDDKYGEFPRYAYASPNYVILNLQQLIYRFRRTDSKSAVIFRFVYGKGDRREMSILNALAKKSQVLKDTLEDQVLANITFPGDYEDDVEDDVE